MHNLLLFGSENRKPQGAKSWHEVILLIYPYKICPWVLLIIITYRRRH